MRYVRMGLLALAVVACGDSVVDPSRPDLYNLTSVNGRALPYVLAEWGSDRLLVEAGNVIIAPNGEFHRALQLRGQTPEDEYFVVHYGIMTIDTDFYLLDAGTWVREGQNLRLLGKDAVIGVFDDSDLLTIHETVRGPGTDQFAADYELSLGFRRAGSR